MVGSEISTFSSRLDLQSAPIAPAWIVDGTPVARNRVLASSSDRSGWTMLWDCTAGTFDWHYSFDETVHVLAGGVTVTDSSGVSRILAAGDIAFFPAGASARWHVEHYIRKVAFCQQPAPALLALALRLARKIFGQFANALGFVVTSLSNAVPASEAPAPARAPWQSPRPSLSLRTAAKTGAPGRT